MRPFPFEFSCRYVKQEQAKSRYYKQEARVEAFFQSFLKPLKDRYRVLFRQKLVFAVSRYGDCFHHLGSVRVACKQIKLLRIGKGFVNHARIARRRVVGAFFLHRYSVHARLRGKQSCAAVFFLRQRRGKLRGRVRGGHIFQQHLHAFPLFKLDFGVNAYLSGIVFLS